MVTIWAVVVGFAILAFIGLIVVDGGIVLRTRSRAFSLAGAAARAGAQVLEDSAAVQGDVVIEAPAARDVALQYLQSRGADGTAVVSGNEVTVTVRDTADLRVYPTDIDISASATAAAIEVQR